MVVVPCLNSKLRAGCLQGCKQVKNNINFCDIYFYVQDKTRERDSSFEKQNKTKQKSSL